MSFYVVHVLCLCRSWCFCWLCLLLSARGVLQSPKQMVYFEHRCFLPPEDPLRSDRTRFPCKHVCLRTAPEKKTQQYVDLANAKLLSVETAKARIQLTQETGCTGLSALRKLPHHDRHLNTPVEPMHLVKVIGEHIVKLLSGVEDSIKVRNEEKIRGRFKESNPIEGDTNKKIFLPLLSAF